MATVNKLRIVYRCECCGKKLYQENDERLDGCIEKKTFLCFGSDDNPHHTYHMRLDIEGLN